MNAKRSLLAVFIWVTAICSVAAVHAQRRPTDLELTRLHQQWAMRFLEPGPHMELAKYFREKGDPLQAFYILENARRNRFETKVFDDAYLLHFGGFKPLDNSKAEEAKYLALLKRSPNDVSAITHLADIYVSRDEYSKAEPLLKEALAKDPQDFTAVAALAEIYQRQDTPDKAKQILAVFESKFPTAAGSYQMRIKRLIDSDSAAAKRLLDEALEKYPDDGELWFYAAVLADREKKIGEAENYFVKAVDLAKDSVMVQGYAAAFFRATKKDYATALKYYLNTYFLDPHAHIDGFAEAKISSINFELSRERVDKFIASGRHPGELLDDPNPIVVTFVMAMLAKKWEAANVDIFVRLMRHDDPVVRWYAMLALTEMSGRSIDSRVKELLLDEDFRVRGLASYMAVKLWKEESFPDMHKLLASEAQVLRFDAVSALLMSGGPAGKKIVAAHRSKEPNETLRQIIEVALAKDGKSVR